MRRRHPTQLPMRFDSDGPATHVPAGIEQALVEAVADLLLATVVDTHDDDEPDDAREDHR